MDPAWVSTIVTVLGSGVMAFVGTKVAIARVEEKQIALNDRVTELEGDFENCALGLQDVGQRVRVLDRWDWL
jgi:hypothetical protein